MSSSVHTNNKTRSILVLGKELIQGIDGTIYAENNKEFCLSLHYNGADSCFFVNGTEIHKFKAKDSEIVP